MKTGKRHDKGTQICVFMSYVHEDVKIARAIESELHKLLHSPVLRRPRVKLIRDDNHLVKGVSLDDALMEMIDRCDYFSVLASNTFCEKFGTAGSYVQLEVNHWRELNRHPIISVLVGGIDHDELDSKLRGPVSVSLPEYREDRDGPGAAGRCASGLAAAVLRTKQESIEASEERSRGRLIRKVVLVALVLLLAVGFAFLQLQERNRSEFEAKVDNLRDEADPGGRNGPELSVAVAVAAAKLDPSSEESPSVLANSRIALSYLPASVDRHVGRLRGLGHPGTDDASHKEVALFNGVASGNATQRVVWWDGDTGTARVAEIRSTALREVAQLSLSGRPLFMEFDAHGNEVVALTDAGTLESWRLDDSTILARCDAGDGARSVVAAERWVGAFTGSTSHPMLLDSAGNLFVCRGADPSLHLVMSAPPGDFVLAAAPSSKGEPVAITRKMGTVRVGPHGWEQIAPPDHNQCGAIDPQAMAIGPPTHQGAPQFFVLRAGSGLWLEPACRSLDNQGVVGRRRFIAPDHAGRIAVTGTESGLRFHWVERSQSLVGSEVPTDRPVLTAAWLSDDSRLATVDALGEVVLWSMRSSAFRVPQSNSGLALSIDRAGSAVIASRSHALTTVSGDGLSSTPSIALPQFSDFEAVLAVSSNQRGPDVAVVTDAQRLYAASGPDTLHSAAGVDIDPIVGAVVELFVGDGQVVLVGSSGIELFARQRSGRVSATAVLTLGDSGACASAARAAEHVAGAQADCVIAAARGNRLMVLRADGRIDLFQSSGGRLSSAGAFEVPSGFVPSALAAAGDRVWVAVSRGGGGAVVPGRLTRDGSVTWGRRHDVDRVPVAISVGGSGRLLAIVSGQAGSEAFADLAIHDTTSWRSLVLPQARFAQNLLRVDVEVSRTGSTVAVMSDSQVLVWPNLFDRDQSCRMAGGSPRAEPFELAGFDVDPATCTAVERPGG